MKPTHHHRQQPIPARVPHRPWSKALAWLLTVGMLLTAAGLKAQTVQNGASGLSNGYSLDSTNATVTLNRVANVVTDAVSEIVPNTVVLGSSGNVFNYDILPTIGPLDLGVQEVRITIPTGHTNPQVIAVSVGGVPQVSNCTAPGAGEYCASVPGPFISVIFGVPITTSLTNIRITMQADAAGPVGSAEFTCELVALGAVLGAQPGDADGNPANANSHTVTIVPGVDPLASQVVADPPTVAADGVSVSTITTTLVDGTGQPVPGKTVVLSSSRGGLDTITQPTAPTDANGVAVGTISSSAMGTSRITAVDSTDSIPLAMEPEVAFTQGIVLQLEKLTGRKEVVVGDVLTYSVIIKNTGTTAVDAVWIDDRIPPGFKYVRGSSRVDGLPIADPVLARPLSFQIGTVPGLVDGNGNGEADPGEPGYRLLSYQLIVGSGAVPGEYVNIAVARDVCSICFVSSSVEAAITVTQDPIFDQSTIIGKVFEDTNRDGWQGRDEPGVHNVMVALDDGTYALTDAFGRYHFPAVEAGHRLVKINLGSLPPGSTVTTEETHVAWVSPGLLTKINFGVVLEHETETIGAPARTGISIRSRNRSEPIKVQGSVETFNILVNGDKISLPSSNLVMRVDSFERVITLEGGVLPKPIEFRLEVDDAGNVLDWLVTVLDAAGNIVRVFEGKGTPPPVVAWDGRTGDGSMIQSGEIYQYQLDLRYSDGTEIGSPRLLFGVDRKTAIALNLMGEAFETGKDVLSSKAKKVLKEAAVVLRKHPDEKIIIEGHSDAVGSDAHNLDLSKRRAQAAARYFIEEEKISSTQFVTRWYGESRPIADNDTPEGREVNRRVEINGEVHEVERAKLMDQYRTRPSVTINGRTVEVQDKGRFTATVATENAERIEVELRSEQGRFVRTSLDVARLDILEPRGELRLAYGEVSASYRVGERPRDGSWKEAAVVYRLRGQTEPGNAIEVEGTPVPVGPDGSFSHLIHMKVGANSFGLVARTPTGMSRICNLLVTVVDRDDEGRLLVAVDAIPNLSVRFPPRSATLTSPSLSVSGITDRGNTVTVNGQPTEVNGEGAFVTTVEVLPGKNPVVVEVTNPQGHTGRIAREVEVAENQIFMLALMDGVVGVLNGKGFLEGAGLEKSTEYYTEGRIAFYLKGRIKGTYIITSAFDTGRNEFDHLFDNLDESGNDRLLTNLDPDRYYPVYGDAGTIVYDAETRGKFYLAVDSNTFHLVAGSFALDLNQTELADYRRTLFGGRVAFQSASQSKYGDPNTIITVFGAEGDQEQVRDELRATGGSLYYLNQREVLEGSEQVSLLIRDKNTGLILHRIPQRRNVDYRIKYEEGRIWFNRPVSSVMEGGSLVDEEILSGNPVFIEVEYEAEAGLGDKATVGARVRQQIGSHLALGGTYVKDDRTAGDYELSALDGEIRWGKNSRLLGEFVESSGADSVTFVSSDGGLSFTPVTTAQTGKRQAWKAALEWDVGELFQAPGVVDIGGYVKRIESGFISGGNLQDQGTEKFGVSVAVELAKLGRVQARHDREDRLTTGTPPPGSVDRSEISSFQWKYDRSRLGAALEYFTRETKDVSGNRERSSYVASLLRAGITEKLAARVEHQNTVAGPKNSQTTLGLDYRVLSRLTLDASGTTGSRGKSAQGGAFLTLGKNRLYVTERFAEDRGAKKLSTVVGAQRDLSTSSKVYTEYQWERGDRGDRALSLVGARNDWDLGYGFRLLLTGEWAEIDSQPTSSSRSAVGMGVSYASSRGVKGSTKNELRAETGGADRTQFFTNNFLEVALSPNFTLLGKYRYSKTRDRTLDATESKFDERSVGLAYRPVAHDRFNALVKYTRLSDRSPVAQSSDSLETIMDVVSLETSLEVGRHFEWVQKLAARFNRESGIVSSFDKTETYLTISRLNFHLRKPVDLGVEYRILSQNQANDRRSGWLNELTWSVTRHLRLGIGYNFTDFSDNEFSDNDYSVHGWFLRVQGRY